VIDICTILIDQLATQLKLITNSMTNDKRTMTHAKTERISWRKHQLGLYQFYWVFSLQTNNEVAMELKLCHAPTVHVHH